MAYLLKVLLYMAIIFLLWNGLMAVLSLFNPVHVKNRKYWGFVLSGVISFIIGVLVCVNKNYLLVLIGLVLPYLIRRIFGGEPDLDASKIQPGDKNLESLIEEGVCLAEEGKYQEALEVLNNALTIDPQNRGALTNKANIFNRLRKYKEAIAICNTVIIQSPEDYWALYYKGIALTNLGECLDAMRVFDRVLKIDPNNQDVIKNKGRCHYKYYEGLGILKEMPDYTLKQISLIDTEVLIEEAGRILARKHGAQ